jgi:MarR family transcriptional regulator, organic hydroperoxide resistance regulator
MTDQSQHEQLDTELLTCTSELIGRIVRQGEQLAHRLGIPAPFMKAMHVMDCPMAMKELGKRMHCDPSFVTLVADMLEKRGLARREPHPADRRVKNLVLTEDGLGLKRRLETEFAARMPWNRALSEDERAQLLALIRKMLTADSEAGSTGSPASDETGTDAMDALPSLSAMIAASLQEHAPDATSPESPPAHTGEVSAP